MPRRAVGGDLLQGLGGHLDCWRYSTVGGRSGRDGLQRSFGSRLAVSLNWGFRALTDLWAKNFAVGGYRDHVYMHVCGR